MKKISKSSRKWLERNKVFFEVFSFLFLGLAAIFISYLQWKTSSLQYKLNELDYLPRFAFEDTRKSFLVKNEGFHIQELAVELLCVYEFNSCELNDKHVSITPSQEGRFPPSVIVDNYYTQLFITNNSTGNLATFTSRFAEIGRINNEIRNDVFCDFIFYHLVELSYRTSKGDREKKFYRASFNSLLEINEQDFFELKNFLEKRQKVFLAERTTARELFKKATEK